MVPGVAAMIQRDINNECMWHGVEWMRSRSVLILGFEYEDAID